MPWGFSETKGRWIFGFILVGCTLRLIPFLWNGNNKSFCFRVCIENNILKRGKFYRHQQQHRNYHSKILSFLKMTNSEKFVTANLEETIPQCDEAVT